MFNFSCIYYKVLILIHQNNQIFLQNIFAYIIFTSEILDLLIRHKVSALKCYASSNPTLTTMAYVAYRTVTVQVALRSFETILSKLENQTTTNGVKRNFTLIHKQL